MQSTILLVDDDPRFCRQMKYALQQEGYSLSVASNAAEALVMAAKESFDCMIIDVQLPDMSGIALTEQIKAVQPMTEIIVMTAYGTIEDGVQAMKLGAMDYSVKTDSLDHTLLLIQRACEKSRLSRQVLHLAQQLESPTAFQNIIGVSSELQEAIRLAKAVAPSDISVLILGETGTGKELFAQAIHESSLHRKAEFVALNCGAIPGDLLESELFGYKKGAFTGATYDKTGLLSKANNGTLFLDEIGDMPAYLQTKLLRVLENREFTPLGSTDVLPFNARVISATNADIHQKIAAGSFRSDLYFRLEGLVLSLPALRNRKEDIDVLTRYFIAVFSSKYKKSISHIHANFYQRLYDYPWYGNVRELRNVIERAVLLSTQGTLNQDSLILSMPQLRSVEAAHASGYQEIIAQEVLPPSTTPVRNDAATIFSVQNMENIATMLEDDANASPSFALNDAEHPELMNERARILYALKKTNGNRQQAAELLNIGIATLYRKLKRYNLEHFGKRFVE